MNCKLTIASDRKPEGWTETHSFDCAAVEAAREKAQQMVKDFNASLWPGDVPRRLVDIKEIPTPCLNETPGQQLKRCRKAIFHVLNAIIDDDRKYHLMGLGTASFHELIVAAASLENKTPVDLAIEILGSEGEGTIRHMFKKVEAV